MITILPDEFTALRRLKDCFEDGEGYDIATSMVQRLACIGLIRRTNAQHYDFTEFGQIIAQLGNVTAGSVLSAEAQRATSENIIAVAKKVYGEEAFRSPLATEQIDIFGGDFEAHDKLLRFARALLSNVRLAATQNGDDTLRIDWLDAQEHIHALQWHSGDRGTPVKTSLYDRNRILLGEGISLRKAIDATMQTAGAT
jgi:hypothetical protein